MQIISEINCLRCGKVGPANKEYCPNCGSKYPLKVVIRDIDMRFSSMILFMVKWAFASIPAILIIAGIIILPLIFLGTLFRK